MEKSLKINEIFYSIQGESSLVGLPTVFVRLTGCNLRCTYCDTQYSYYEGQMMSFVDLQREIAAHQCPNICITGGEPLLQKLVFDFMSFMCDRGYNISLETSGAISVAKVDPRVHVVLDVKTPDSGAANSFRMDNLQNLPPQTEFKFVICSEKDFFWAEEFIQQNALANKFCILYSPSFQQISEKWLAKKILLEKSAARLQLQLHKYIWPPETRGV